MEEVEGRLDKLLERLDQRLARLEKAMADFERIVEMMTTMPILPQDVPNQSTVCHKCNMDLSGVMGYVCPRPDCPVGLSGPTSTV